MRSRRLLATVGALALVLPVSMATTGETSSDGGLANLIAKAPGGKIQSDSAEGLFGISGRVVVMVELKDDPVAVVKTEEGGGFAAAQEEEVESKLSGIQDKVATTIETKGGAVKSKMQFAFNGTRVTINSSELKNLGPLPEVKAVRSVSACKRSSVRGILMIGAPKAWEGAGGATRYTGEGAKAAVIDTDIDCAHATFGGPGTIETFNKGSTTKTLNSEWFGPNAPRVKGGVDLVSDEYNGTGTPTPDNNPIDYARAGHGIHIAGTVGRAGVPADGKIYTGAYDQKTHESGLRVGPGIASRAKLYAVRVFGCAGSTSMATEAINWAVKNKMDVINVSPGTSYGKRSDADTIASSNAVATGVVVLAPADNYGSQLYLTGSPASDAGVISIAANNLMKNYSGAQLTVGGKSVQAMNANDAKLPADTPVHVLKGVSDSVSLGCADSDYANVPEGSIVVTVRDSCAQVARAVFRQKYKAATVVMINSNDDYVSYEGKITGDPSTREQLDVMIPLLTVKRSDGAALAATDGKQMTFAANMIPNPDFTKYGDSTPADPRSGDSALRPSAAAPDVSITLARVGSGNDSNTLSGASMAAPHATGVTALTKQTHPSWNSQEISVTIVSTADASKVSGYRPTRGGGLVGPVDSTTTQVFAYDNSNGVKNKTVRDTLLNLGYQGSSGPFEATKTITPVNKGNSEVTFNGEVKVSSQSLPARVKFNTNKVTAPAGSMADVIMTLTMKVSDVPSSLKSQNSQNSYEVSGDVQFTPGNKTLSVPYLMVPRSTTKVISKIGPDSSKIGFQDQDGTYDTNGFLSDQGATDPKGDLPAEAIEAGDGVDIASVGVATTTFDGEKALVFAINSHTRHSDATDNSYQIPIDNNDDDKTDYIVFSADSGRRRLKIYNGVPEVFVYDTATKTGVPAGSYTLTPSSSDAAPLTVKASSVSVTGKFQYRAITYGGNAQARGATDGMATYDPESHPLNDSQSFQVPAGGSKDVSVMYNKTAVDGQESLKWMAVAFDNDQGTPEAVTDSLTGGGASPTVSPATPSPTITPANPDPTDSASPGDPSAPVSPVPTRAPLKPGLPKTGDLG